MNLSKLFVAATAISLAAPLSANAASLTNGGFEDATGFADNTGGDTMRLTTGQTLPGWTVIGNEIAWVGTPNPYGIVANTGSYSLDITGYHDNGPYGGVSQTVATCAGCAYTLSFALGSMGQTPDGLDVSINGVDKATFVSTNTLAVPMFWQTESYSFTASSASTTFDLLGSSGGIYIGLDDVALELTRGVGAVPEPSTWAMMLVGFAGLGFIAFRRQSITPFA